MGDALGIVRRDTSLRGAASAGRHMTRAFNLAFSLLVLSASWAAGAEPFTAGAVTIDITPPVGFPMWGYGARHDAPCAGVRDPLKARAVVLTAGDERLAIVSVDLGRAPTRDSMDAIRTKL